MKTSYRILLLLCAAVLLLTGCVEASSTPSESAAAPTPTPSPQEIVARVVAATQDTTSAAFRIDFSGATVFADPDRTFSLIDVAGDLRRPDGALATIRVRNVGSIAEIRLVSLDGQLYVTNPLTREWLCVPAGALFDPVVLFDEERGIDQLISTHFENITLVGVEEIEGRPHYHLAGTMPGAPLHEMSYGLLGAGTVQVDLWADQQTLRASQIVLVDTATDPDNPSTWTLTLSDYNKTVDLRVPVECS